MKTKIILSVLLILVVILPGCVYSLYPLYTNSDLVYDKNLEGVWGEPGSKDVWKFENLLEHELAPYKNKAEREKEEVIKKGFINKNTYLLTYTEDGVSKKMLVNMCKLGNNLFMDLFPEAEPCTDHYIPVHSYAKVKMTGHKFEFAPFASDYLDKLLEQNTIRIKHESFENYKIITASTDDLQQFVMKYADRQELYAKPTMFTKSVQ